MNQDPPPDLALEIDMTSKSVSRFPIYARLGVLELWCYKEGKLHIYLLQENDEYQESRSSLVFPDLPVQEIPEVINQYNIVCKDEEKFVKKLENGQLYTIYKINS